MPHKTLPSGLDVTALGRCSRTGFCPNTATHWVEFKPRPDYEPRSGPRAYGWCQQHVDSDLVSNEEYERRERESLRTLGPDVQKRSNYVVRPLSSQEAAEVAYEKAAPERWEAEGMIGSFRRIAEMYSAEEIDGVLVDAFSAQHVVQVYEALNEKNQARMAAMDVVQVVEITFRLVNSQR